MVDLSRFGTPVEDGPATAPARAVDLSKFGTPVEDEAVAPNGSPPIAMQAEPPRAQPPAAESEGLGITGQFKAAGKGAVQGLIGGAGDVMKGSALFTAGRSKEDPAVVDRLPELAKMSTWDITGALNDAGVGNPLLRGLVVRAARQVANGADPRQQQDALRQQFDAFNANFTGPLEESETYKAGQDLKHYGEEVAPMSEAEAQSIGGQAGKIIGGVVPYVAAGVVAPGAALATGAAGMSLSTAGSTFEQAKAKGATDEQASNAAGFAGVIGGALGSLPLGVVMRPVSQSAPGLTGWAAAKLAQAGQSGLTFATVGEAQEYLLQQVAKEYYDPQAGYSFDAKRVIASLIAGGALGAAHPLHVRPEEISSPEQIQVFIDKAKGFGTARGAQWRGEIDDFLGQQQQGGPPLALPSPGRESPPPVAEAQQPPPLPTQPAPAAPPTTPTAALSPAETQALRQYGYSDEQIASMSDAQRRGELADAIAAQQQPAAPSPAVTTPAEPPPAPVPAAGQPPAPAPQEAPPPQAAAPPAAGLEKPPLSLPPPNRLSLQSMLADPRSVNEIQAEQEKQAAAQEDARNWQPTDDWQPVPTGAQVGEGVETRPAANGSTEARLPPTPGTRDAPILLGSPEDVKTGADITATPTPGQAEAGNYQKRHLEWNGLDITVETEAGQTRSGVGPTGAPWSVEMPAPYGYLKGTRGRDGDQVDVYVGPNPASDKVFVFDQVDPDTRKFDEHKLVIGTDSVDDARAIYERAFSDGSGAHRVGAVTEMSVQQLKAWLAGGETKQPIAFEPPKNARPPRGQPLSLFQFLAKRGGIREYSGELTGLGLNRTFVPGYGRLMRASGMPLDRAREAAVEAGYLPDTPFEGGVATSRITHLLDALQDEAHGNRRYSQADLAEVARRDQLAADKQEKADRKEAAVQVRETATKYGIKNLTEGEIAQVTDRMLIDRLDVEEALTDVIERAAMAGHDDLVASSTEGLDHGHAATGTDASRAEPPQAREQPAGIERNAARERAAARDEPGRAEQHAARAEGPEGAGRAEDTGRGEGPAHPENPVHPEGVAASDGLDLPDFLRREKPKVSRETPQQAPEERGVSANPDQLITARTSEADIRAEGDRRWRNWIPSKENRADGATRPRRQTFVKQVRQERRVAEREEAKARAIEEKQRAKQEAREARKAEREKSKSLPAEKIDDIGETFALRDDGERASTLERNTAPKGWQQVEGGEPQDTRPIAKSAFSVRVVHDQFKNPEIAKAIRGELNRIGLGDVGLRLVERMEIWVNDMRRGTANGSWRPGESLMTLALDNSARGIVKTMHHEALHALRSFDMFTKGEWSILERASQANWRQQYGIDANYRWASDEKKIEEGVAHAYADWVDGKSSVTRDGRIVRLFKRIKAFFEALGNALRGLGFKTPESIFSSIERGEVGRRAEGLTKIDKTAEQFSTEKVNTPDGLREQHVIPGAEKISDRGLAERRAAEPKRAVKPQKGTEGLPLFGGEGGGKQMDMFDAAKPAKGGTQGEMFDLRRDEPQTEEPRTPAAEMRSAIAERFNPIAKKLREGVSDLSTPVKDLQKELEARQLGTFPDTHDFYVKKRLFPGRVAAGVENFNRDHLDPLVEQLREKNISLPQAALYLYARHAQERNAAIAKINPEMPDGGSGMTTEQAKSVLERIEARPDAAAYKDLSRRVGQIRNFALDTMEKAGLEKPEVLKEWRDRYDDYVPLRGYEDAKEDAPPNYRGAKGFVVRGKEVQPAFGRRSKADNPLVNLIDQTYRAIDRAEKNTYLQALHLALSSMGEGAKDIATRSRGEPKREIDPATGLVRTVDRAPDVRAPNTVSLKIGGNPVHWVFKDAELAEGIKRMSPDSLGMFQFLQTLQNKLKAIWTHYSPDFLARHFLARYPIEAALNAFEQGPKAAATMLRDSPPMLPFLGRAARAIFARNKGKDAGEYGRYWDEMREHGGAMTFRSMRDMDLLREHLQTQLMSLKGRPITTVRHKWRAAIEGMDTITNALDNALRLSAYASARKAGKSPQQAALAAREATVDFQLKGKWSSAIGLWFPFGNVAIQTAARMTKAVARSRIMKGVFGGTMGAGFLLSMFNYLIGGNDKDGVPFFDKIPEWDKRLNIIILNPFDLDKKGRPQPIKIPMPYNWALPLAMGYGFGNMAFGSLGVGKSINLMTHAAIESLTPFGAEHDKAVLLAPELARPFLHVSLNEKFSGSPIHVPTETANRQFGPNMQHGPNAYTPWKRSTADQQVGQGWEMLAQALNDATGGSRTKSGKLDFYPEDYKEILGYVIGTPLRFGGEVTGTASSLLKGERPKETNIPLGRVFRGADYDAADRARAFERGQASHKPWLGGH